MIADWVEDDRYFGERSAAALVRAGIVSRNEAVVEIPPLVLDPVAGFEGANGSAE